MFHGRIFPPIKDTAAKFLGHGLESVNIGVADEENGDATRRDQR